MSHASAEMPYFINPSKLLTKAEKHAAYAQAELEINALLTGETDVQLKMVSINCIMKMHLPYYYWVGFYCRNNDQLTVGPYQGTLGCLHIAIGKGVCGTVAKHRKTMIVEDVAALAPGEEHIACDPNSRSEIVLPVINPEGELIAVFDIDSSMPGSFDEVDQYYLERILKQQFSTSPLTQMTLT